MSREQIVRDNITRDIVPEDSTESAKIELRGSKYELDLSETTAEALVSLITGEGIAALSALFPEPAKSRKRSGKANASAARSRSSADREYLRSHGFPGISDRGNFSADQRAALAKRDSGATGPAVNPPAVNPPAVNPPAVTPAASKPAA